MSYNFDEMQTSISSHLGYHIAPEKGLINDPSGLIQFKGAYHIFYQWNPKGITHKNKSWGHIVSKDLVHFIDLGIALLPDCPYDKDGCYTGCTIEHDGVLYIFYTGNVRGANGERITYQCLATSIDGYEFTKHGPIIEVPEGYTGHIRDPKVWKANDNTWYMILGAQSQELKGTTLLYKSHNIYNWELIGPFIDRELELGYMWECPNYIAFPEMEFFQFSPQGIDPCGLLFNNIYQSGYISGKFHNENFIVNNTEFIELDRGFEFYAPQFFQDENNRHIMFAWMGAMNEQDEANLPTTKDGWAHMLSLPREITCKDGKMIQNPIEELKILRKNKQRYRGTQKIQLVQSEIEVGIMNISSNFELNIKSDIHITYNQTNKILEVSRINWTTKQREYRACKLEHSCNNLRIFLDSTSMEMFVNKGEEVFSLRYFNFENDYFSVKCDNQNIEITIYELVTS